MCDWPPGGILTRKQGAGLFGPPPGLRLPPTPAGGGESTLSSCHGLGQPLCVRSRQLRGGGGEGGLQQHPLPGATHRSAQGLWGCHRPW